MSDKSSTDDQVVVELRKRGKLVVGEPYFTPGVPLVVDRHGLGNAGPGDLAVVRTGRGRARVEHVLGSANHIDTVLEGLLHERGEHGARETVPEPPPPSLEGRTDLRDLPTITIDPETAKDFDDAISVVREGDGLRAYVHIADVSHFVSAGTELDLGAADRSCSVYV
ncbi:MAG: RNB domain-containing ribonuclease, partial [Gaiellales bacterium]